MKPYILKSDTTPRTSLPDDFESSLNDAQREAVFHTEGPLLVIAGAGSGKTKTLVYRVARLVHDGVDPKSILLLTFTRKAAQEMLRRASSVLDSRCQDVSGGTFHAFASTMLRQYGEAIGYNSQFTILDRSDSEDILSRLRKEFATAGDKRFPKKGTLMSIISKATNTQQSVSDILYQDYPQFSDYVDAIEKIRTGYAVHKKVMQVMDYDDLLTKLGELLNQSTELRQTLQQRFQFIMVDEYQDTNAIQAEIIHALAGENPNIMVVGDDAQSIYSFRGANYENMMDFPNQFSDTRVITLEQNYRSEQPILDLTNSVIARAKQQYSKQLFSHKDGATKPVYIEADSEHTQSQFVAQKILELREEGVDLKDMAVLIRSGWHSNDLEIMLNGKNIPFVKVGGFKFVETSHIKDLVSYVRVIFNPSDQVSWNRILLFIEGVGPKAASTITEAISAMPKQPKDRVMAVVKGKKYEQDVEGLIDTIYKQRSPETTVTELLDELLIYYRPIFKLKYDDYTKRESDLVSLKTIAENYTSIEQFLTELTLDPPTSQDDVVPDDKEDEKITISTIHSAKGLEWHTVFIISAVDGYIPSFQSLDDPDAIEEERRLMYVALTRAEKNLFIIKPNLSFSTQAQYRFSGMQLSTLSRFLDEANIHEFTEQWSLVDDRKSSFSPFDDHPYGSRQSQGSRQSGRYGNYAGGYTPKTPKRAPSGKSNLPSFLQSSSENEPDDEPRGYRF